MPATLGAGDRPPLPHPPRDRRRARVRPRVDPDGGGGGRGGDHDDRVHVPHAPALPHAARGDPRGGARPPGAPRRARRAPAGGAGRGAFAGVAAAHDGRRPGHGVPGRRRLAAGGDAVPRVAAAARRHAPRPGDPRLRRDPGPPGAGGGGAARPRPDARHHGPRPPRAGHRGVADRRARVRCPPRRRGAAALRLGPLPGVGRPLRRAVAPAGPGRRAGGGRAGARAPSRTSCGGWSRTDPGRWWRGGRCGRRGSRRRERPGRAPRPAPGAPRPRSRG